MEDNENKIFEENAYWPQTLGDEAVGKKLDILNTSNPTETASVIAEKEKKIYDRPAEAFKILPEDLSEIYVGTETQLELVPVIDEGDAAPNAPTVVWESSDLSVAFVGDGNILGALSEGQATITATDINNPSVLPVSKNITVKVLAADPVIVSRIFTITYNANGGELGEVPASVETTEEGIFFVTTRVPIWSGHRFLGWSLNSVAEEADIEPESEQIAEGNITLYAIWEDTRAIYSQEYLTIDVLEVNENSPYIEYSDEPYTDSESRIIYYSRDKENWIEIVQDDDVSDSVSIEVSEGDRIYLKGNNEGYFTGGGTMSTGSKLVLSNIKCNVSGNIMSLIYGDDFVGQTELPDYAFANFFAHGDSSVGENPDFPSGASGAPEDEGNEATPYGWGEETMGIINAENLILPSTTSICCYAGMFANNAELVSAPALPATVLCSGCYDGMFYGCCSLASIPEMPDSNEIEFSGEYITDIAAGMFAWCTSLERIDFPIDSSVSEYAFGHCTSLVEVTVLYPSSKMFYNCTSLNKITCLTEENNPSGEYWVYNVANSGTFVINVNNTTWNQPEFGGVNPNGIYNDIPMDWNILYFDPESQSYIDVESQKRAEYSNEYFKVTVYDRSSVEIILQNRESTPDPEEEDFVPEYMSPVEYSLDKETWTTEPYELNPGESVYIRSTNNTYWLGNGGSGTWGGGRLEVQKISSSHYHEYGSYNVSGNIMSLIYGDDFVGQTTLPGSFYRFFNSSDSSGGEKVISAKYLICPATIFTNPVGVGAYEEMFCNCSDLRHAPTFPEEASEELVNTFTGCESLIQD